MKAISRILLILVVVSTGLAWAASDSLDQNLTSSTPENEQALPEIESDENLTVEDLELMEPDVIEAGTCCLPDCYAEKRVCKRACNPGDQNCLDDCDDDFDSCVANC